jgi:spermidine synthase
LGKGGGIITGFLKSISMKQPWWKRFLSNFFTIPLEKVKSEYSTTLEVVLNKGRYALCTEHAVYSYEDLYINFRDSFYKIDLDSHKIDKVLILGVGLLSIPIILEKLLLKNYSYTCVDIDPEVVRLAKKYGLPQLESKIELHCADAFEYIKKETDTYGLIIVDIFIDDKVPSVFETTDFLQNLKRRFERNGLLMYNRMAQNNEAIEKTEQFYKNEFKKLFNDTDMLVLKGNRMLLAKL